VGAVVAAVGAVVAAVGAVVAAVGGVVAGVVPTGVLEAFGAGMKGGTVIGWVPPGCDPAPDASPCCPFPPGSLDWAGWLDTVDELAGDDRSGAGCWPNTGKSCWGPGTVGWLGSADALVDEVRLGVRCWPNTGCGRRRTGPDWLGAVGWAGCTGWVGCAGWLGAVGWLTCSGGLVSGGRTGVGGWLTTGWGCCGPITALKSTGNTSRDSSPLGDSPVPSGWPT
jgi:hypothetical protein